MITVKARAYGPHFYHEKNSFRDHGGGGETVGGAGANLGDMRTRSAGAAAFAASAESAGRLPPAEFLAGGDQQSGWRRLARFPGIECLRGGELAD